MHEGKHGILDGVDDIDDIFGINPEEKEHEHDIDEHNQEEKEHEHDVDEHNQEEHEHDKNHKHGHGCNC